MTVPFTLDGSSIPLTPQDDPVHITVGRGLFSSDPQPVDDFSGSSFLSRLRMLKRIRNLDGPDDVAGALPAAFATSNQPAIELGLLAGLFPLVALSAKEAVTSARAGYARGYPGQVRATLDQQQRLIGALRHGSVLSAVGTDADLGRLVRLHEDCVRSSEAREHERARGFGALVRHNIARKWHRVPGTSAMCEAFLAEARRVIAARTAQRQILEAPETTYQHHLTHKCAQAQRQTKRARWPALFTGIGMSGMATGMGVSAGASAASAGAAAAQASGQAAAQAAGCALDAVTGGIMMGAQAAQMAAGVSNLRVHVADHRRLLEDHAAIQAIAPDLPRRTRELHAQDTRSRLADSRRSQACDIALSTGQGLMLASSASGFVCPPVALALAGPGIALTLGASVCGGVNEAHREHYLGDGAVEPVKQRMRLGNLGPRLRDVALDTVLQEVAEQLDGHQDQLVHTRLWCDILAVLAKEDVGQTGHPRSAQERYRDLLSRNRGRRGASHLLPAGLERLHALRREHYPEAWFDGPATELHERLSASLRQHPAAAVLLGLPDVRREILFATVSDLVRRRDPVMDRLLYDDRGRRVKTLHGDAAFFARLRSHPLARAIHLRHENEILARHLTPVDRFGRSDTREALTDLAHTKAGRERRRIHPDRPHGQSDRPCAA